MRNSKNQTPKTKEISNLKHQLGRQITYRDLVGTPVILQEDAKPEPPARHPFDLEERTAVFGEKIVRFSKRIPRGPANDRLINQIVGAGTSVGANFCEANDCVSKKDFRFSVKRCIKEGKETRFFLRMIIASEPSLADEAHPLYREATELIRILASMWKK
jgi:four helix bundle protein